MASRQGLPTRKALMDLVGPGTQLLFADGHDDAILGISERAGVFLVVYDVNRILRQLRVRDGIPRGEAQEFFDFNIAGSWVGKQTPV